MSAVAGSDRVRSLVDAGIALASEPSLDALLERLLALAAELTSARYAALGVIAPGATRLERFLTHGIDPETAASIGDLPKGAGLLGRVIRDRRSIRVADVATHPDAVGFPPGHPQMRTFLGVPIVLRGVAYGNLYLTEKSGGSEFTEEDEQLVGILAAQAAVAIENVRLFEAAARWSARLESLNEVANALACTIDLDALLDLVARRLLDLIDARHVSVVLPSGSDDLRVVAAAGDDADSLVGTTFTRSGSKSGRVLAGLRSERVDSMIDDPDAAPLVGRLLGARTGLWVPLVASGQGIGVLVAHDRRTTPDGRFADDDLRLAEAFASRAAVAVDLSSRTARDVLGRVIAAQELERRRLARELHDETGQALTSILLGLRRIETAGSPSEEHAALDDLRGLVVSTLTDVRRLAVELHPKVLDDFGLVPALERLVSSWSTQTGLEVELAARLGDELRGETAVALYRIAQEALVNVVKHARARHVSVVLTRKNAHVLLMIEDDGHGFDPTAPSDGAGIAHMRERAQLLGGRFLVESAVGSGATLAVEVPVE
jgi:signal transduction histidine kinase